MRKFYTLFIGIFTTFMCAKAQLVVTPNQTAANLANSLLGGGVVITNPVLTCPTNANGLFSNGGTTNLGLGNGIVLTTGTAANIANGNGTNSSVNNGITSGSAWAPLTGSSSSYDLCMLEFDIEPKCNNLKINYKFASEEYPEYVGAGYNDAFGFFISGPNPSGGNYNLYNMAVVPGTSLPVNIDNINSSAHSAYYISNSGSTIVYDGMTTVLTASANVTPCASYHLRLAIVDGGDPYYDSGVFLQQAGISCTSPTVNAANATICTGQSATLTASGTTTYSWSTGSTASSIVVSPTVTTSYTVGGSNVGTCIQDSKVVTVTVNSATASITAPSTITCSSPNISLSGSGGGTYSWSGPGIVSGGTSATPVVNQGGVYTLTVTNSGCTNTKTVSVTQNTTTPSPTASNSATLTCATNTVALSGGPAAGVTYQWSGPGFSGGTTSQNAVATAPGTYTLKVTSTVNGCTNTAVTNVVQNTTTPSPTASNTGTLSCTTSTLQLSGTPASGVTYQWSGPGFSGGTTSQNAVATAPGTYTLKVTDAVNSCTASAVTTVVQNITSPSPTASNTGTLSCTTSTLQLNGGPASGVTYQWSGPGLSGGTTSQNAVATAPGTYTLKVTDAINGCTATAVTTVTQNTTTPSPTASNSATLSCTTSTVQLSGGPATGVTYQWSGPGFSGGTTSQNAVATAPGTYTLLVTNTVNGCTNTAVTTVAQNTTTPSPTASNSATLSCTTSTVQLSGGPAAGVTYQWSGPGFSGGTTSQNAVATAPGTYTLLVTNTVNGCTNTAVTTVAQNTTTPSPTASNSATLSCTTSTVQLSGGPAAGVTYQWSGPGFSGGTNSQNAIATAPGTYTLKVTDAVNNCTATAVTTVSQNTATPVATSAVSNSLSCTTTTAQAVISTTATPVAYTWTGPGIVSGGATSTVVVNAGGSYAYTVTNTTNGCKTTGTAAVTQNTTVTTPSIALPAVLNCTATTINLTGTPGAGVTYTWTGGGITGGANTATPSVNQPGVYTLSVTNTANGCVGTATSSVTQNTATPSVAMPATQTITCASPTVSLAGAANPSTCTAVWTGGVCSGAASFTASACSPATYTLTITDPANACTSSGTVDVVPSIGTPSVAASVSGSITCANTSVQITATTTMTPVSYNWSGPGSVTGSSSPSGTVTTGGTYQCVVTNTLTGCASTITTFVPTNTTAVTAAISPTGTITCVVNSLTLNASPSGAYDYSWTPTAGITGTAVATPTVTQGGNYSVVITDQVNGCTGNANITVPSDLTIPTVTVNPSTFTTTCASPTVQLTANTSTASVTYSWTSPGTGSLDNASVSSPVASGIGEFSVVVTNTVNGCVSSVSTATVYADASVPTVSLSAGTLSLTCVASTVSATATTTNTPVSYAWSPSPLSGGTSSAPVFDTPGVYTLTLTNTANSCSTTANVTVVTNTTIPTLTISPTQTLSCNVTTVAISTTVSATGTVNYSWTGPGITGASNGSGINANQVGNYDVIVTDAVNGCTNTATGSVVGNTVAPTASINAVSTNSIISCLSPTVTVSAVTTPSSGVTYTWNPGGANTQNIDVTSAGIVDVIVMNTASGCTVAAQYTVTGNTTPPSFTAPSGSIPCAANSTTLNASSTNTDVTYSWSGPNANSIISGSNTATPTIADAGSYVVTATDNANGCTSTATVSVSQNSVSAAFTADQTSGIAPLTVNFTNQSSGAMGYSWTFGNGSSSTATDPNTVYNSQGTYTVVLIATAGPCSDTAYATIVVEDGLSLEIPNVFTPNNDSVNDVFTIKSTGVKEITLEIFNRWGEKLYEFSGPKAGWDGKTGQGALVPDGTYFYFVKADGYDGHTIERNGTVNLYR